MARKKSSLKNRLNYSRWKRGKDTEDSKEMIRQTKSNEISDEQRDYEQVLEDLMPEEEGDDAA